MSACATTPTRKDDVDGDNRWMDLHDTFCSLAKDHEPEVLFVGDSHISFLEQSQVYGELFAPLHSACFGIKGDTAANLLWRLQNGELQGLKPKVIVMLVGTNNRESPDEVVAGIKCCAEFIRSKQPQATIMVLKVPPRGHRPNKLRELFKAVNEGLPGALASISNCLCLDTDAGFIASDGLISVNDMYDFLHLTNEGYRKAFENVYVAVQAALSADE